MLFKGLWVFRGEGAFWPERRLHSLVVLDWPSRTRLRGSLLLAVPEPIAFTVQFQDVDMVGEPVQQGSGEPFRSECLGPFIEGEIAGDQSGTAFVAPAEDLKQQLRAGRWL